MAGRRRMTLKERERKRRLKIPERTTVISSSHAMPKRDNICVVLDTKPNLDLIGFNMFAFAQFVHGIGNTHRAGKLAMLLKEVRYAPSAII